MQARDKYYFVSDVHLGVSVKDRRAYEAKFLSFLDSVSRDARAIYLLGDIFDFWYEYRYVIPRGHTRTLGRLAQLADAGIEIYFFPGNHDVWAYGYFEKELGIRILEQPYLAQIGGASFCLGHGDGLGKTDPGFRLIRWMFHNRFLQVLFSALHPRWAFGLGYAWAGHSFRVKSEEKTGKYRFRGKEEPIFDFVKTYDAECLARTGRGVDYYIFGHYHAPMAVETDNGGRMFILGDWMHGCEYAVFDGTDLSLKKFD